MLLLQTHIIYNTNIAVPELDMSHGPGVQGLSPIGISTPGLNTFMEERKGKSGARISH